MDQTVRRRAIVSGRVQGVGFRWSVRAVAQRLRLAGFATNRADGTVEVEAEGEPDAVAALLTWLETGPPGAAVADVAVSDVPLEAAPHAGPHRFEIR